MKWMKRTARWRIAEWYQEGETRGIMGELAIRQPHPRRGRKTRTGQGREQP
jgi:hypothetical protein